MIGESPTRPACLNVMPPVEVAAARWPAMSSATAPTEHTEGGGLGITQPRLFSHAAGSLYHSRCSGAC